MNSNLIKAFTVGAIAIGAATMAHAQQSGPARTESQTDEGVGVTKLGKYEYDSYCAACHGLSGKGDGPYVRLLKLGTVLPNLTELSKKNGGAFPFTRVYRTIDGRQEIPAHGSRDMPIWGREFSSEGFGLNPYYNPEGFARAKILALAEYIYTLQEK